MEKPLKLGEYYGKGYPDEDVKLVNKRPNYFSGDEAFKFKLFALNLVEQDILGFNGIPDENINSWTDFYEQLITHYL